MKKYYVFKKNCGENMGLSDSEIANIYTETEIERMADRKGKDFTEFIQKFEEVKDGDRFQCGLFVDSESGSLFIIGKNDQFWENWNKGSNHTFYYKIGTIDTNTVISHQTSIDYLELIRKRLSNNDIDEDTAIDRVNTIDTFEHYRRTTRLR